MKYIYTCKALFFQKTVCGSMTECSSLHTTMTMITESITVDHVGAEGGGITHATRQILTGSMETQNFPKGSIGITFICIAFICVFKNLMFQFVLTFWFFYPVPLK